MRVRGDDAGAVRQDDGGGVRRDDDEGCAGMAEKGSGYPLFPPTSNGVNQRFFLGI